MENSLDQPVFITGVYRSGTTILTGILGTHQELDISHPSVQYFRYIIKKDISPNQYKEIIDAISERINYRYGIELNIERIKSEIEDEISSEEISHKIIYDWVSMNVFNNKQLF